MGDDSSQDVRLELERLRGAMAEGFTRVEGQLALIAQKQDTTAKDVADLDTRVSALEARRVPWALMSSVATVGGGLGGLVAFLAR